MIIYKFLSQINPHYFYIPSYHKLISKTSILPHIRDVSKKCVPQKLSSINEEWKVEKYYGIRSCQEAHLLPTLLKKSPNIPIIKLFKNQQQRGYNTGATLLNQ